MIPQPRLNVGDRATHPDNPCLLIVMAVSGTHAQCCCPRQPGWHTYSLAELTAAGPGTTEGQALTDTDTQPRLESDP